METRVGELALTLCALCFCGVAAVHGQSAVHAGQLDVHEMHSKALKATRTVRVWTPSRLPPGVRCSVLYLNDGQNLFGDGPYEDGGGWHAEEAASRLIADRVIDPLMIVGIDNEGDRARAIDYLPVPDPFDQDPGPPGADRYLDFVIGEVMPFVDTHYATLTGPAHTGFGGSSYGAASAFYAAMARPGVFGRLLLESPSVGVGNGVLLERAKTVTAWPERVDIGIGTGEGRGGRGSATIQALTDILARAGLGGDRLRAVVQDGGRHDEAAWASRFPDAIAFLFRK
jgi:predicted alpha/beta superfamily hydrolase